jgi:hypothetical protein
MYLFQEKKPKVLWKQKVRLPLQALQGMHETGDLQVQDEKIKKRPGAIKLPGLSRSDERIRD